jgi:hypothetical protein
VTLPDNLPRSIRNGVLWLACGAAVAAAMGFQTPWSATSRQLDDWVKAHAVATATIEAQGRAILVLQERDSAGLEERKRILDKLDEMAMVLYSLERRTR